MVNRKRNSLQNLAERVAKIYTPTEEELAYKFTKDELIKLCEHKKVCVRLDLWNPINDFYNQMKRRGKVDGKPPEKVQKILLKLGNHYKNDPRRLYSRETIEEERLQSFRLRKCWNVRWLNETEETNLGTSDDYSSRDSDIEIQSQPTSSNQTPVAPRKSPPSYMENLNYHHSQIVGDAEGVLASQNFADVEGSESENSLQVLEKRVQLVLSGEGSEIISSSPLVESVFQNYENFVMSIPTTSTQSQEQKQ